MDRTPAEEPIPMTSTLSELEIPALGENYAEEVDAEDDAEASADVEAKEAANEEDQDAMADAADDCDDVDELCDEEPSREVITTIDALRAEADDTHAMQVSSLIEIIASADFDADTKSSARDSLDELQALASSSRMLETVIGHMGFDDVLVRATGDSVLVNIQVASLDDVPTREELAELYVLAGIEFGNHRNGNISINFQPLN